MQLGGYTSASLPKIRDLFREIEGLPTRNSGTKRAVSIIVGRMHIHEGPFFCCVSSIACVVPRRVLLASRRCNLPSVSPLIPACAIYSPCRELAYVRTRVRYRPLSVD
jgi:hypothetical protein